MTHLERARSIVDAYDAFLRAELPPGALLFDAHTHLGDDIDGMQGRPEQLDLRPRRGHLRLTHSTKQPRPHQPNQQPQHDDDHEQLDQRKPATRWQTHGISG